MGNKFIPTLQAGNGYTYLHLKGILDEDNMLTSLLSQIQGRLLLIDMAELERINSCGVRDWVNWLNQIQALGTVVILLRCSPCVVAQANMVTNFAAEAFIHSFYAPYVHPDTGDEQSVLLFTEEIRQNQPLRAPKIFNDNGEELEFDEFEESYFAFLSDPRMLRYQVSPDIQAVIQYFLPEAATRQPVILQRQQPAASKPAAVPIASQPMKSVPQAGGIRSGYNAPIGGNYNSQSNLPGVNVPRQSYSGIPAPQAVQRPSAMPQPARPMMRHEQPPLPSGSNYQKVPSSSVPEPRNAMPEPKPAPSPVSPVAAQSMSSRPQAEAMPSQPSPVQAASNQPMPSQPQPPVAQAYAGQLPMKKSLNGATQRKKIILGATFVGVILIIAILILVAVK